MIRWPGERAIVIACGPSATAEAAESCRGFNVIAVSDAWRLAPFAHVLYSCDARWWNAHNGARGFAGERWTSWDKQREKEQKAAAKQYGLHLVAGARRPGFSTEAPIHYGNNSGFQAVNLAILFGAALVVLVGFDMRRQAGRLHFFGDHKDRHLSNTPDFAKMRGDFAEAAKTIPAGVSIVNATPQSALTCFPLVTLTEALTMPMTPHKPPVKPAPAKPAPAAKAPAPPDMGSQDLTFYFTALMDFDSPELRSGYVKGLVYTARPQDETLRALCNRWEREGKISIGGKPAGNVGGTGTVT